MPSGRLPPGWGGALPQWAYSAAAEEERAGQYVSDAGNLQPGWPLPRLAARVLRQTWYTGQGLPEEGGHFHHCPPGETMHNL